MCCLTEFTPEIALVFKWELSVLAPFLVQTALRIEAKVVKFRRENYSMFWRVWLDV